MSEQVGALESRVQACPIERASHDRGDCRGSRKTPLRCFPADEYATRFRRRPIVTQIDCERLADIHGQGHPVIQQALAANKNLPGTPINIVELYGNNLPGAKAETGEEKKKRVVATARSRVPITTAKHADNFFASDVSRKSGQTPISNRGNGRRQVHLQFPTLKKKAEEGAESGRHQLGPSAAHGPDMPQDKAGNIARPHYF